MWTNVYGERAILKVCHEEFSSEGNKGCQGSTGWVYLIKWALSGEGLRFEIVQVRLAHMCCADVAGLLLEAPLTRFQNTASRG